MKFLKWSLAVVALIAAMVVFVGIPYLREHTKKHSPQKTTTYTQNGMDLSVHYSSPFKKGRVIFGELVPYHKIWRTGANEPTTFTTKTEIKIINKTLPAGTYSVWTRPEKEQWTVLFNKDIPDWGVTLTSGGTETTHDPSQDMVQVQVPVNHLTIPQESFLISFEEEENLNLILSWDKTRVKVPINPKH